MVSANSIAINSNEDRAYSVYSQPSGKLYVINISDKANPTQVSSGTLGGAGRAVIISADDNFLYVADYSAGIKVFDIEANKDAPS